MRKPLPLRQSIRRMATAAVGCLVLLSLTAPVSSAQAPAGGKRDVVYDPVYLGQDDSGRG
ncbi:hypothetical protein [Kitasatospora sp. NBC_01300]|uniref:hypothetical protein n=1 Tax=Kitasatospora sp. NBC_01300 TaxID=2903574 RepID=UPI002F90A9FB|nr:hypothetical protein OG556_33995 [Kitasatospora sp. NBC_01300]